MTGEIPEFNKYANSRIFSWLADIREFNLVAEIPPIPIWSDDIFSRRVVGRLYESVRDVIQAAGFYNEDQLKSIREIGGVMVEYGDDRFDFGVICSERNIVIKRRGTRLSNFHDWYKAFMPSAQGLLSSAANILSEETGRRIDILRGSYAFNFLVYDIQTESTSKRVRNSEIVQKLLKGFPDDQGSITDSPSVLESLGRVDLALNRWIGEEGSRRRLRFSIEAPGNLGYSSLWFNFDYMGETYTSPEDGHREAFNSSEFLSEYTQAYVSFLRDSAINGFLEWLMRGYHFKSTAAGLP